MFDLSTPNRLMTLGEAARELPRDNGKPLAKCTVWRWITRGVRGIKLRSCRLGAQYYVSVSALLEFGEALAALGPEPYKRRKDAVHAPSKRRVATLEARAEAVRKARDFCKRAGV